MKKILKEWTVIFDTHEGAPHEIKVEKEFGKNVFYGGDNHEFINIHYDDLYAQQVKFNNFLKKCDANKTKTRGVVTGNHEGNKGFEYKIPAFFVDDKVLFTHGDIFWPMKKYKKWRNKKPGCSHLKLAFVKFYSKYIRRNSTKIPKKIINKAIKLMQAYECTTIVFGHRHPAKIIEVNVKHEGVDYTIINCPRGKSKVMV